MFPQHLLIDEPVIAHRVQPIDLQIAGRHTRVWSLGIERRPQGRAVINLKICVYGIQGTAVQDRGFGVLFSRQEEFDVFGGRKSGGRVK